METTGTEERTIPASAWLFAALIAALLTWQAIVDWNAAPDVPASQGLRGISLYRGVMFGVDLLLLGLLFAYLVRGAMAIPSLLIVVSALALGIALEASGKLRAGVLAVTGKIPGGPTRLQTHQRAIADLSGSARRSFGEPIEAGAFEGRWTRRGRTMRYDVRSVQLRAAGDGLAARVAIGCEAEGRPLCEMPEVPAILERVGDGRVQAVTVSGSTPNGRYWLLLAPGSHRKQPMFVVTHVMLDNDGWQVSSGPSAWISRDRDPVPVESFAGVWRRTDRVPIGDVTRIAVSLAPGIVVRGWVQCPQNQECELGSVAGRADPGGKAGASRIEAAFVHQNVRRGITLEPRPDGALDVEVEATTYTSTTEEHRRHRSEQSRTRTYVSGSHSSSRSGVFVRDGG